MKHKMIALLLAATMVAGTLAACGQKEEPEKSSEPSKVEESKSQEESKEESNEEVIENFNEEGMPIVDEEITLKVMLCKRDVDTAWMDPQDIPLFKEISEYTGVNIEWERVFESEWETKTNLMWSTGEYPDVIFGQLDVEKYGVEEGVVLPLDDLMAKYVPNVTERIALEENDPTLAMRGSDGKIYSVPYFTAQNICVANHLFINQTWLDALELEMPTDLESLTDVLREFKAKDPNGNGAADEIPFVGQIATIVTDTLPMFRVPMYKTEVKLYIDENKEVQFAPIQDGFRECVEWFHLLYDEGLLDPDAFTNDSTAVTLKLIDSVAGFFSAWRLIDMGFNDGATKDAVLYMPEDSLYSKTMEFATNKVFVTATNEHPEATMRWINELLETETMFTLFTGIQLTKEDVGGYEGGWYYDDNGKISNWNGDLDRVNCPILNINGLFFAPSVYYNEVFNQPPSRLNKMEYSQKAKDLGVLQTYSNSYLDLCKFDAEKNDKKAKLETDLDTAYQETLVDFVKNGVTDDKWNDWVALCEDIGYEEYVQLYTEALAKVDVK